jgi:4-hydroxybenzoate polyprenyltransferase
MFALQATIGTINDLVDAPADAGRKTGKPLPRGLLSRRSATWLAIGLGLMGLALSAVSGTTLLVVAVLVLGVGFAYDFLLKGTVWSWLPFALGVPLLPVYAWLGATGGLPSSFALLIPTAVVAGAGLAVANLLADLERDEASGAETLATRLGQRRAWALDAALLAAVLAAAFASLVALGGRGAGTLLVVAGAAVVVVGVGLALARSPQARERAWECQAVGVGIVAAGWVWALAETHAL